MHNKMLSVIVATCGVAVAQTITPANVALGPGQTQQFTGTCPTPGCNIHDWGIDLTYCDSGPGSGSIDQTGLYTAPTVITSLKTVHLRASFGDLFTPCLGTITLLPAVLPPPPDIAQGPPGPKGDPGVAGAIGATGQSGPQGVAGDTPTLIVPNPVLSFALLSSSNGTWTGSADFFGPAYIVVRNRMVQLPGADYTASLSSDGLTLTVTPIGAPWNAADKVGVFFFGRIQPHSAF